MMNAGAKCLFIGWHDYLKSSREAFRGNATPIGLGCQLEWGNCRCCNSTLTIPEKGKERERDYHWAKNPYALGVGPIPVEITEAPATGPVRPWRGTFEAFPW